jgi:hypothetical protein
LKVEGREGHGRRHGRMEGLKITISKGYSKNCVRRIKSLLALEVAVLSLF